MTIKRVALIGGQSFTSAHLLPLLLDSGLDVITSQQKERSQKNFLDLCDYSSISTFLKYAQPNVVLLLAGKSNTSEKEYRGYHDINVLGPLRLANAIQEQGNYINQFIFASSSHVYGAIEKRGILETDNLSPQGYYGISKFTAESLLKASHGDRLVVIRPFNYTGAEQNPDLFVVPKIVKAFKERKDQIELGNIWPERDISDVRDISEMYLNLILKEIVGTEVNFCSGQGISISEIIAHCKNITGLDVKIKENPDFIRKNEPLFQVGSPEKAKELGLFSRKIEMRETLEWMLLN
jgi:nucleoside-diphosphate-sugar epimerase